MSREDARAHLNLADEKLAVAHRLLEEGFVRDAASRAYYAMYHAGYAVVRTKGHAPKTHRGLAALISQDFVGAHGFSREQLSALKTGQSIRELGDYEATTPPTEETAETLLAQAEEMVARARDIVG